MGLSSKVRTVYTYVHEISYTYLFQHLQIRKKNNQKPLMKKTRNISLLCTWVVCAEFGIKMNSTHFEIVLHQLKQIRCGEEEALCVLY